MTINETSNESYFFLEFDRSQPGKYCQLNKVNVLKEFIPVTSYTEDAIVSRDVCEDYCKGNSECWGCSIHCTPKCQWNAIPECGKTQNINNGGMIEGDITQKLNISEATQSGRVLNRASLGTFF